MSKGRSLELYFVDGRPDGMLTAEVFNWTGPDLRIPKIRLPDGLRRPLLLLSGAKMCLEAQIREHLPRVSELRNWLRTNGDLQVEQQFGILKTFLVFKSPSAIADFVSGRSTNGRTSLKLPRRQNLRRMGR